MAAACPDDDALQAWVAGRLAPAPRDAVIAHVADCRPCRELTAALARGDATAGAGAPALDAEVEADTQVGRFHLRRLCGRGGMGVVFEAHDPELDRVVALKLVTSSAGGEEHARFVRECRALARLRHANVVALHEVGEHHGRPYLVMDWIAGGDLRRWVTAAPRAWREILDVIVDAGRGLVVLHEAGMLHRDVKPDNVLVDGAGPRPRGLIGDLGLVRIADGDATLTQRDALLGTPRYMAPEQCKRCTDPVLPAS
jgi:serine/threonine protein kinase